MDKKEHPVATKTQFVSNKTKDISNKASYKKGEDESVYEEMAVAQTKKREEIVKSMKKKMSDFKDRYGDRAKDVMYATATKMAMKEEVKLDEISRDLATRAAHGFADKGDRALKNKDSREYKRSERGRKMAVDKATGYAKVNAIPRRVKLPEEVSLIESVKAGSIKLKDGTNVKLSKEDASALTQLFSELNSANKKKMEQRMTESKKGFDEIINFAKEAM